MQPLEFLPMATHKIISFYIQPPAHTRITPLPCTETVKVKPVKPACKVTERYVSLYPSICGGRGEGGGGEGQEKFLE